MCVRVYVCLSNAVWAFRPYLERNLRVNMGIVDRVMLFSKERDPNSLSMIITRNASSKYPGHVARRSCLHPFGCLYQTHMNRNDTLYIKIDDDTVFIKDGYVGVVGCPVVLWSQEVRNMIHPCWLWSGLSSTSCCRC